MVKGNPKSSATSATRKKHLKKHVKDDEPPSNQKKPKVKGERGKKKEPRVKMYIPPVKPAPVQPDPLETTGLAHTLPADLLIVLRNISKKAQVTKTRALEELQAAWVNPCLKEGEENHTVYTLVEMLPVWVSYMCIYVETISQVRVVASPCICIIHQSLSSRAIVSRVFARISSSNTSRSGADPFLPSRVRIDFSTGECLGHLVSCNV